MDQRRPSRLLEPLTLKRFVLRNRIVFAPVSTRMAGTYGSVSGAMLAYYADKALGGAAAVITETFHVDNVASRFTIVQPSAYHDRFLPAMSSLADAIANAGAAPIAQIGHAGRQATFAANNRAPVAPSRIPDGPARDCEELDLPEIERIVRAFADAAGRVRTAGFQGVEIHAGNGYLINQFLSPAWNRRSDRYGADRARFLAEIIEAVSERIGPRMILGVRLGCSDFVPGGLDGEEALRIAARLPLDAVDYLHTSAGTSESNDYTIPPLYHEHAELRSISRALREKTGRCVILTGSVNRVDLAEELLERGEADLVGMGRPLLADPLLPRKVSAGRADEVRPCIRCNQGCLARVRSGRTIRCSVNPRLGYEWSGGDRGGHGNAARLRVLVAGGGPAGMTAALRCAECGCKVTLCERERQLGGLLTTALFEPMKQDIVDYLAWLCAAVDRSGVAVRTDCPVDVAFVERHAPDLFIDATGSVPIVPPRDGSGPPLVLNAREALRSIEECARKRTALVIGGGSAGCEIACTLASRGVAATVIEQATEILGDLDPASALGLLRLLEKSGVSVRRNAAFRAFGGGGVLINDAEEPLRAELVVVAMGSRPGTQFARLDGDGTWIPGVNLLHVGDARRVGRVFEAVHDTYWLVSAFVGNGAASGLRLRPAPLTDEQ